MNLNPINRILFRRTTLFVVGILLIIETVFVSEVFTTLMEIVIKNGGGAGLLFPLLLLKMPEIFDFGLPIAILIGFYFAVAAARDNSELIICAAVGVSWRRLPWFAMQIGTLGFAASILVSGYLVPMAAYTSRMAIAQLSADQITRQLLDPNPTMTLQQMANMTLITVAAADKTTAPRGNLFIYHPSKDNTWHASLAQDWQVERTEPNGTFVATLGAFTDYWGQNDATAPKQPLSTTKARQVSVSFQIDDLLREIDRTRRKEEISLKTLGSLFGEKEANEARLISSPKNAISTASIRVVLGEKIARALLCPAAALLALLGVAMSQYRLGRLTALPLALVAMLGYDVLGREILGNAAVNGGYTLALASCAMAAVFLLPPGLFIFLNGEKLIFPVKDPTG